MKLSITGADNLVDVNDLKRLASKPYTFELELAILLMQEKQGVLRYPTFEWRQSLYQKIAKENMAIHLCGKDVFDEILQDDFEQSILLKELKSVNRIQININARNDIFSQEQIHSIYQKLLDHDLTIILQYHTRSHEYINDFLDSHSSNKIHILLDESLGKGMTPDHFMIPDCFYNYTSHIGFAGGIAPHNLQDIHKEVKKLNHPLYWLDLESGARTNNVFDLIKVYQLCKEMS